MSNKYQNGYGILNTQPLFSYVASHISSLVHSNLFHRCTSYPQILMSIPQHVNSILELRRYTWRIVQIVDNTNDDKVWMRSEWKNRWDNLKNFMKEECVGKIMVLTSIYMDCLILLRHFTQHPHTHNYRRLASPPTTSLIQKLVVEVFSKENEGYEC